MFYILLFIGTSSVARGLSVYLDALFNNQMSKFFHELLPMNVDFLAKYPDFFSFFIVILLSLLLSIGVKESSILNNIFTTINLATVCLVIGTGIFKGTYFIGFLLVIQMKKITQTLFTADPSNWSIKKEDIPDGVHGGEGGFMPFGVAGVMAGAAKCFYGFVGFDCLATCGTIFL